MASNKNEFKYSMVNQEIKLSISSQVKMRDQNLVTILGKRYLELEKDSSQPKVKAVLLYIIWFVRNYIHTLKIQPSGHCHLGMNQAEIKELFFPKLIILYHSVLSLTSLDEPKVMEMHEMYEGNIIMWVKVEIINFKIKEWDHKLLQKWSKEHPTTISTNLFSESHFLRAMRNEFINSSDLKKMKPLSFFSNLLKFPGESSKNEEESLLKFTQK